MSSVASDVLLRADRVAVGDVVYLPIGGDLLDLESVVGPWCWRELVELEPAEGGAVWKAAGADVFAPVDALVSVRRPSR